MPTIPTSTGHTKTCWIKTMTDRANWTRKLLIICVGLAATFPLAAEHVPPTPDGLAEGRAVSRLFVKSDNWEPMIEVAGHFGGEDTDFGYRAVRLGSYYRVHQNVKMGAFYRVQWGARHDDDWLLLDNGDWEWRETTARAEHVVIADVTPRFLLDFIPGENWVAAVKGRYLFNTFNMHQTLLARPQLTYFWLHNRRPILNVTAAYGAYMALNFSDQLVYRRAPYLDVVYHAGDLVKLNAGLARETVHWSSSQDLKDSGAPDYSVDQSSWQITLGLIFRVDP